MGKKTFDVISPVNDHVYVQREYANAQQIQSAFDNARRAFEQWKIRPLEERIALCLRITDYFAANKDAIAQEITWQMGRPIKYSGGEVNGFIERTRAMLHIAPQKLRLIEVPPQTGFKRYIRREPLGAVFSMTPWNYPFLTAVNGVIPALVAGNIVIMKASAQTPLTAERIANAGVAAGLPDGVLQFLHLDHQSTAEILRKAPLNYVGFTGSVAGGRAVEHALAGRFIESGLELGGKDPAYVRADANFEHAVTNLVDGAFFNSGQSCCGIERIYVDQSIFTKFVEAYAAEVKKYVLDDPTNGDTTLGPMVRAEAADFVRAQIREGLKQGARSLIDTRQFLRDQGAYLPPQVLIDVNHSMRVMRDESFGPVVGIMPVKNDAQAIALMNDSAYGLTAAVWTQDVEAAARIGENLHTGTVFMNRCDYLDPYLAWTGVGDSGRGCTLSEIGYERLTRPKSFHLRLTTAG
ncbi:MAG: aldehyde dehydrogenase family protein [Pseudomonadota bacterium]